MTFCLCFFIYITFLPPILTPPALPLPLAAFNVFFLSLVFSKLITMSLVVAFASVRECICLPCLGGLLSYLLESLGLQFSSNMKIFSAVLLQIIFLSPLFTLLSPRTLVTHILEYLENHWRSVFLFLFLFLCF